MFIKQCFINMSIIKTLFYFFFEQCRGDPWAEGLPKNDFRSFPYNSDCLFPSHNHAMNRDGSNGAFARYRWFWRDRKETHETHLF